MSDFQLALLENTEVTKWDFEAIKAQLEEKLSVYKNMVYTDESIKSAKNDRTDLNKAKKVIEDARKAYKKHCLEPYEALEPRIAELTDMIEAQRQAIDETVKDFEQKQKEEKEKAVRAYYEKKAAVLGDLADKLYDKILDQKWLNASTSKVKYEEGIQLAINKVVSEVDEIRKMNSPFFDTVIEKYVSTLSVDEAKAKHEELVDAANKAGLGTESPIEKTVGVEPKEQHFEEDGDGINITVYADQYQLRQITDFMKAIGVEYKIN